MGDYCDVFNLFKFENLGKANKTITTKAQNTMALETLRQPCYLSPIFLIRS